MLHANTQQVCCTTHVAVEASTHWQSVVWWSTRQRCMTWQTSHKRLKLSDTCREAIARRQPLEGLPFEETSSSFLNGARRGGGGVLCLSRVGSLCARLDCIPVENTTRCYSKIVAFGTSLRQVRVNSASYTQVLMTTTVYGVYAHRACFTLVAT